MTAVGLLGQLGSVQEWLKYRAQVFGVAPSSLAEFKNRSCGPQ